MWRITKVSGEYIILPETSKYCPFCDTELVIHRFRVSYQPHKRFWHCDVAMKCPKCSWFTLFGVPISKEDADKLRSSKYHGQDLTDELLELDLDDEQKKIIEERLKSLGYW